VDDIHIRKRGPTVPGLMFPTVCGTHVSLTLITYEAWIVEKRKLATCMGCILIRLQEKAEGTWYADL
jgi:hypothetical protein